MIKEGKIGVQEAICLSVIAISNRIFFTAPAVVDRAVGTAGWYMPLISAATAFLAFIFICMLLKRFPGKDLLEIFSISFGKVAGFIVSFTYSASFLVASGILVREFIDVLKIFIFTKTPQLALIAALVAVLAGAAYLGLESIARVARLATYILLFSLVALLIMASKSYKITNLFPIFGYGIDKTLIEGISRSSAYSEIIVLAVLAGSFQGVRHIKKAGNIALLMSSLIISSSIFFLQMAFPYETFQEQTVSLYILARLIKFGTFVQRLDPVLLFLWIATTIIASSIVFYCAVSSYCKTFRLQDTRPAIIPIGILLISVSIIPRDFTSVVDQYIELLRVFPIFLFYIIPLAALIVAAIRKKKGVSIK